MSNPPPRRAPRLAAAPMVGGVLLVVMTVACLASLPYTLGASGDGPNAPPRYDAQNTDLHHQPPLAHPPDADAGDASATLMGRDKLGRSMLVRCLLGGAISLGIGLAAATISVLIGTTWGLVSGYSGGRVDSAMMRIVDVLYGLPYILLVVLLSVAFAPPLERAIGLAGNVIVLLVAIGAVSWLTLARVVRGQVLSIKSQPFIEAARAAGVPTARILFRHVLPNLIGPIIVYTTLTVPQAILQESFLSFLGIGVRAPLPSWGNLAAEGLSELNPVRGHWWLLAWPCLLLGTTLLALNFLGDGLRDRFDPRGRQTA